MRVTIAIKLKIVLTPFLQILSSGTETVGFWLLNGSYVLSLCKSPIKFSRNKKSKLQKQCCHNSKLETPNVSETTQDELGIHTLIDFTFKKLQLIVKNINIDVVTIVLYFDTVGSGADVYNDDDGILISPATD